MNKIRYIAACIIFLLLFSTNILSDKYDMDYPVAGLNIEGATDTSRSQANIEGTGANEGDFVKTTKVDLPKGEYKIKLKYETDTDLNTVVVTGKTISKDIAVTEQISSQQNEKLITLKIDEDVQGLMVSVHFSGEGTYVHKGLVVYSDKITNTDTLIWMVVFIIVFAIIGRFLYHNPTKESHKKFLVFLCLLGITVFASYPMFNNYIIKGHDILFHLTRIEGIKNGLLAGQFPVRLHSSSFYGYGYTPAIFYPELFLYIPALFRIMGVTTTGTVELFIILLNFTTAGIMYFAAYRLSKVRTIGMISSILYVLASYHLCDVYTRFALGEALAMAFIPLLIYGIYELFYQDYTKWFYVVLGATGILQSHIITTLVVIAFVGLTALLCIRNIVEKNRLVACIKASVVTILINLWFAVPLVTMMGEDMNVSSLARSVENLTLYASQIFINFTVNGNQRNVIGLDMEGVMPLHIGLPIMIGVVLTIFILADHRIKDAQQKNVVMLLLAYGALSAYATTNLFPWKIIVKIPLIGSASRMIQFPWRLLGFAIAFLSIAAAYGVFYFVSKVELRKVLVVAVFAITAIMSAQYLDDFLTRDIYCYKGATVANVGIGTGEYYYKGTSYTALQKRGEVVTSSSDSIAVTSFTRKNGTFQVDLKNSSNENQYIEVPLAYYPVYKAILNESTVLKISKGDNNVVKIEIPANSEGKVIVKYHKQLTWLLADTLSAITLLVLVLNYLYKSKYKMRISK